MGEADASILKSAADNALISIYEIGRVKNETGIDLVGAHGDRRKMPATGWQHEI